MRIKTCEVYCKDKMKDFKEQMKAIEHDATSYASKSQIDKIEEQAKLSKQSFQMELERFQQYLKDQNSRSTRLEGKTRETERQFQKLNDMGGFEEILKIMKEVQEARKSMTGTQRGSSLATG